MDRPIELTAESLWNEVAGRLKGALNETTYRTWFAEAEGAELSDDAFVLGVPNDFTREWIEGHFLGLIGAAVRDVTGQERRVALSVTERIPADTPAPAEAPKGRSAGGAMDSGMNPKYTFDLFVIGSSNRFAHAAALAVAEAPAQAYNPLFIYGGTGLGKTHLMQAIAQYVAEHSSDLSVRYVTSETFMNDFINSLRDKRIEGFKQRYRTYDLLLVDDVQFFEHKERIQEEFFHTFNSLYEAGSQIVMSSDRPPRDIATLEERLRSRFEWGLITDVQPPDLETRIAILRKKVKTDRPRSFRRARRGRAQGRLPPGRGGRGLDPADPGARLRALPVDDGRALRRETLPEHRLSTPGCDVSLARAHGLVASQDREGVRRPRPHHGHPCDLQDCPAHP